MTLSLQEMRAKMESKNASNFQNQSGNSDIFKFGDLKAGDEVRIRFIEDADPSNGFFWRERHSRTLKFNSLLLPNGTTMEKDTYVSVPAFNLKSNETSADDLPAEFLYKSTEDVIQQKIKGLWIDGDKTSQALYNKFGKKVTYLLQGFVHSPGYEPKLYRFLVNKDLFNLIKTFMNDSEIEDVPCSVNNGRDFILRVAEKNAVINGKNMKVKDYVTNSKWSSKVTPLTQDEIQYIATHGAFDLKKFLAKHPTPEQEEIMLQMYNASYDGLPFDIKNWSSTFRPDNIRLDQNGNIKVKEGERTADIPTEVPQAQGNPFQQFTQPQPQMVHAVMEAQPQAQPQVVYATNPATFSNPVISGEQQAMQQMAQQYTQPMNVQPQVQPNWNGYNSPENTQMLVDSPVQVTRTAPQIARDVTETVSTTSTNDSIQAIMAKLNMNH